MTSMVTKVQQSHLGGVPVESRKDMAAYLASKAKVFIYLQNEPRPDVPPWAIAVCERPEFEIDCTPTRKRAIAYAKVLGLVEEGKSLPCTSPTAEIQCISIYK